ncbi:hypothetical protein [Paenibacillus sp. NEAU-GSW1]|uniref:hypothetical protein n=1 Tax=Paenibacillus sp. NEAU-GSW1 TaxID=2682486 RepID=UPI0020A674F1|nr:hypothetical protein [Paenibacillus sp. NEAU-GSW1]
MTAKKATYSTGILRKPTRTSYALVDVVNLNADRSRIVAVQVYDWSERLSGSAQGSAMRNENMHPQVRAEQIGIFLRGFV